MKLDIQISPKILEKLEKKHNVSEEEVFQCFLNRTKGMLEDTRVCHKTNPPTFWFVAETTAGRALKIVFMQILGRKFEIKTAYEANNKEIEIYEQYA